MNKSVFFLMMFAFISSNCQTRKDVFNSKPFNVKRSITAIHENENVYVLIADNNDIIEVFKPPFNKTSICKKIVLNKRYNFKVLPVSDLIQRGIESPKEYILNDSTIIKYNNYYSLKRFQFLCKKDH